MAGMVAAHCNELRYAQLSCGLHDMRSAMPSISRVEKLRLQSVEKSTDNRYR